jgi:hypothetical protein
MKSLEMLTANPAVEAIGWTLLHSLWEGATVAAVLGATLLILRTARARYLAACAALFALLALFTLTLLKLAPESTHSFPVRDRTVPVWSIVAEDVSSAYWRPNIAVMTLPCQSWATRMNTPVLWLHWNKTGFRRRPLPLQEGVS